MYFVQVAGKLVDVWLLYATSPYYSVVEVALDTPTAVHDQVFESIDCFEEERGRDVSPRPIGRIVVPTVGVGVQLEISAKGERNKYRLGVGLGVDALVFVPVVA